MEKSATRAVWRRSARILLLFAVAGLLIYVFEHWGDRYMTRLTAYVASQGRLGVVIYIAANALGTMLLVPQGFFTVPAGMLFGWKLGALWASIGMTLGAVGAFFLARYGVRDHIHRMYKGNRVFVRLQQLSRLHPLHVISLSRIIPVIPFPVASYLLGVTEVRSLPYALLTWLAMLPETVFLASGGHLLHTGLSGKTSLEAGVALAVGGLALAVVVHRMKRKFLNGGEGL
ncbi:hypothetical protein GM415_12560 [Pseudodesulfovibrio cashew]|uniref:TVP38/TMEM64 family membrane protein n=1 Tax=Pseudodesulfovibrio cashew TaxID=2678688 RepID=A0A6I6JDL7_9BACT|nr:VTT domain-containing protein [Pseudodesulfovibrio cashew]QGY40926.1 hypothetical protein GM415_12560 [Pseudodesulfovibrio cashew]